MDDSNIYAFQFRLKSKETRTNNTLKFEGLYNSIVAHKESRFQYLNRIHTNTDIQLIQEQQFDLDLQQIDNLRSEQQTLLKMQSQLEAEKMKFDKRNTELRYLLNKYNFPLLKNDQDQDHAIVELVDHTSQKVLLMKQIQEKYLEYQQKKQQNMIKALWEEEESVRKHNNRVDNLKEINDQLLTKIQSLEVEEAYKKKKLQNSFKIGTYLEFFSEIQKIFSKADSPKRQSNLRRSSTRREIVETLDNFFSDEDVKQCAERLVQLYREQKQTENIQANEFKLLNEEKQDKEQQLSMLNQEIDSFQQMEYEYIHLIQNGNDPPITINDAYFDGGSVSRYNNQILHHIKENQHCLISIHFRMKDFLKRMCLAIIWLQEYTKKLPHQLYHICMNYLTSIKLNIPLFIPRYSRIKSQKKGSYINPFNRSSNTSFYNSPVMKTLINQGLQDLFSNETDNNNNKPTIWKQLLQEDLMSAQFCNFTCPKFDHLNEHQQIILAYESYAKLVQQSQYHIHYQKQFKLYREILRFIYVRNQTEPAQESNPYFINVMKQTQIQRLTKANIFEQQVTQKRVNQDEKKYHEYFINQSNKIQKQNPRLHDKLITRTLQDIDQMKQQEMEENYQTSDLIDDLDQERINIKGLLKRPNYTKRTSTTPDTSLETKSIRSMVLIEKLSKVRLLNRPQPYKNIDKKLASANSSLIRKMSDYYPAAEIQPTSITKSSFKYPPNIMLPLTSRSCDPHISTPLVKKKAFFQSPDMTRSDSLNIHRLLRT